MVEDQSDKINSLAEEIPKSWYNILLDPFELLLLPLDPVPLERIFGKDMLNGILVDYKPTNNLIYFTDIKGELVY